MKKNNKHDKNDKKDNESLKTIILTVLLVVVVALGMVSYYFMNKNDNEEKELAYTELIQSINDDKVEKIKMKTGSYSVTVIMKGEGEEKEREKTVLVPSIQAFMEWINDKVDKEGKKIELIEENINPLLSLFQTVLSFLPTILLVVLMFMIFKMQGLGGDSGKVYGGEDGSKKSDVRFDDIAGPGIT